MSGSVTPLRRPREEEDEDEDEDDFEISIDGENSPRSSASKRARLDLGNDDEGSEASASQVLPDSFRRSPKNKQRASNGLMNGPSNHVGPQKHQPGSIVRVKLTNFVTYTKAEFHPGPSLNMIIGPNGTGKSTLVCAICLGLGWKTSHLGRAKHNGEFVKHGSKRAQIEIELAADPERHDSNPIITTMIMKDSKKAADNNKTDDNADFAINGKKSTRKAVLDLAHSFSIQVDNLCQFLPQDRVVEFAALSPVNLLTQTQRAAAPAEMSDWHEALKAMRRDQRQAQIEQQSGLENLKSMQNRQRMQEADVERLRERTGLQERITALEKLRPFPVYNEAKKKHQDAQVRKKDAQAEFKILERRMAPRMQAVQEKQEYLERVDKIAATRERLVQRGVRVADENKTKLDNVQLQIEECIQENEAEKDSSKAIKQSIPRFQNQIAGIQRARQNPPEAFDPAAMNEQVRVKTRELRELDVQVKEIAEEVGSLKQQADQRRQIIFNCNKDKENLRSQAGQQANKLKQASPAAAKAWEWIQNNRDQFQGQVFGPSVVECQVKNPRNAGAVESVIRDGEKVAFTVTSQADFKKLNDQLYGVMKLNNIYIRTITQPLSTFKSPISEAELRNYGLESWVLDLIEGPEPVLAMLCDNNNVHQTAFTSRDLSDEQFSALQQTSLSSWVTASQSYTITRRREYGPNAVSTRVQALREARFFTDVPVDQHAERVLDARIAEARGEIEELAETDKQLKAKVQELKETGKQLLQEKKNIEEEKNAKQRVLSEFNGLATKEEGLQRKLDDAKEQLSGFQARVREINDRADKYHLDKGQLSLDYANSAEALRGLHIQHFEAQIVQIEGKSDLEQLKAQHADEERLLREREAEVRHLSDISKKFLDDGKRLGDQCRRLGATLSDAQKDVYNEVSAWLPDQMETEIQSVQARLEMTGHGAGNENLLRDFEERGKKIEERSRKLNALQASLEELENKIAVVRGRWEPQLDELVEKISAAFAENFAKINCVGEVAVHKDEDFEAWAIQIRVKFRDTETLSILDSHRQSGGERAVSTIFYLMALQSLARAPFRVVDEINQGMDPRNERLVHSRMVDIACAENSSSQYFLITPKLLSGLKYHPSMKVHCIASGEYMPQDHRELDFAALAKKALAIRGAA